MRLDVIEKANTIEIESYNTLWMHDVCTYVERNQSVVRVQNTEGIRLDLSREYSMCTY